MANPEQAIQFIAAHTLDLLLLETCVDYKKETSINLVDEDTGLYSQSFSGSGCRPGRVWIYNKLNECFENVYIPVTQPAHSQFPTDWNKPEAPAGLSRAVFIASRNPLENSKLIKDIPYQQSQITGQ